MKHGYLALALGALLLFTAVAVWQGSARAQEPQQTYSMDWWTVDGGGTISAAGGGYSLGGTSGQGDAGLLTGGVYTLGGGFWRGGAVAHGAYTIYLPLLLRDR